MNLVRCESLTAYKLRPLLVVHRSKHYGSDSTDSTSVCETVSGLYCLKAIQYYASSQQDVSPNVIPYVIAD